MLFKVISDLHWITNAVFENDVISARIRLLPFHVAPDPREVFIFWLCNWIAFPRSRIPRWSILIEFGAVRRWLPRLISPVTSLRVEVVVSVNPIASDSDPSGISVTTFEVGINVGGDQLVLINCYVAYVLNHCVELNLVIFDGALKV